MGQASSRNNEMKFLFNVGSDQEFSMKLVHFLGQKYQQVHPQDARQILKQEKFHLLFEQLVQHLSHDNFEIVRNSLRLLQCLIAVIYEDHELCEHLMFSSNPKVEVQVNNRLTVIKAEEEVDPLEAEDLAQPRMHIIVDQLCGLLFRRQFTIQGEDTFSLENDPRMKNLLQQLLEKGAVINLKQVWRGLATLVKYPNDQRQFFENRSLVLGCLLSCLGEQLFHKEEKCTALKYLVFEDHVEMFVSLWAIILFHKRSYFWFQDNFLIEQKIPRILAALSAQILQLVFAYENENNKFRQLVIETKLLDYSFDMLLENVEQSMIHDTKLVSICAHNNHGVQEFLGLVYFLLVKNVYRQEFIQSMSQNQMQRIFNTLLYYVTQYFQQKITFHVYVMCLELIDYLLGFENIGKFTQEQMNVSLYIYQGSYQEFILCYYSQLLLYNYQARIEFILNNSQQPILNYRTDILCKSIEKLSIHVRNVNCICGSLFGKAIVNYFYYNYLLQQPSHAIDMLNLSVAAINMIYFKNMNILHNLLQFDEILKFQISQKQFKLFFEKLEQKQNQELQQKEEKEERLERYLQMWKEINFQYVRELQNILKFARNLINVKLINYKVLTIEQLQEIYDENSWAFINICFIKHPESTFSYMSYAYRTLLQQIEYMPIFDSEQCIYQ